jgi:hypothetical protein
MLIGVVSDTHGCVPAQAHVALAGVHMILHAGDVGSTAVLDELGAIAPVTAVRGNCDTGPLAWTLRDTEVVRVEGVQLLVTHKKAPLLRAGLPAGITVVVSGHTHRPSIERDGNVLLVDPGSLSSGDRHGGRPTAALLELTVHGVSASIVEL